MRHWFALVLVVLAACGGKDDSPRGLCERGCKKLLACAGADDQLGDCVTACTAKTPPPKTQVEQLEGMTCEQLAAGGAPVGPTGPAPAAAPAPRTGCTADCRGCAGDGTSCYAVAGGANGIPCEPCCCQPGGGAPVWSTP